MSVLQCSPQILVELRFPKPKSDKLMQKICLGLHIVWTLVNYRECFLVNILLGLSHLSSKIST